MHGGASSGQAISIELTGLYTHYTLAKSPIKFGEERYSADGFNFTIHALMANQNPVTIAQITDTHLFSDRTQQMKGVTTFATCQAVLKSVQAAQPDMLLLTGDLSQDETPESYQHLGRLVSELNLPVYWIPGNHDDLTLLEVAFQAFPIHPDKTFVTNQWQVILLNSVVYGQTAGHFSQATLDWLNQQLKTSQAKGDRPCLIALHHHPVPIELDWADPYGLENAADFFAVLDRYSNVQVVIFGHIHQELQRQRNGVTYLGSPSTCTQFVHQAGKLAISEQTPGFRLVQLYDDGHWATQVKRI